jgi:Na+/proline symporter
MSSQFPYHLVVVLAAIALIGASALLVARGVDGRTVKGYFFAGGKVHWILTGTALTITLLWGMILLVASSPVTVAPSEYLVPFVASIIGVAVLGFVFGPRLRQSGILTLASYVSTRYSNALGLTVAVWWVVFTLVLRIPFTILVGTRLLHTTLQWDAVMASLLMVVLPGLLVVLRGYVAVLILHVAAVLSALLAVIAGMINGYPQWPAGLFWDPALAPLPATAVITGSVILAFWYSCADQLSVHHALATRDNAGIRAGAIFAGVTLVVISLAGPAGMHTHTAGPIDGALVTSLIGSSALLLAMAALSSQFLGVASLAGIDVFQATRRGRDEASVVLIGRTVLTGVVIVAILAGTAVSLIEIDRIDLFMRGLAAAVPPVAAVIAVGTLWRGANRRGALWALWLGWSVGAFQSTLLSVDMTEIVFGMIVTLVISASVLVIVSLTGPPLAAFKGLSASFMHKSLESRKP